MCSGTMTPVMRQLPIGSEEHNHPNLEISHPHHIDRAQGWLNVDKDVHDYVTEVVGSVSNELEQFGFIGAYLHGSLASGSYHRGKSDIDLLFVIEETMTPETRGLLASNLAELSDRRPTLGDIEVLVLTRAISQRLGQEPCYEVRYYEGLKPEIRSGGIDFSHPRSETDLLIQIMATRSSGVVLVGEPIIDVFGEVPVEEYRNAARQDLDWILERDHILETPIYGTLNCCRWLTQEAVGWGQPVSKEEAAEWVLEHSPNEHHRVIAQVLTCYRSSDPVPEGQRRTDGHGWNENELYAFKKYVRSQLRSSGDAL